MNNVQFSDLPETAEMLSVGFLQDLELFFADFPNAYESQVILFSGTVPSCVEGLSARIQRSVLFTFDAVFSGSTTAPTRTCFAVRVLGYEEARAGILPDITAVYQSKKAQNQLEKQEKAV